MRIYVGNLPYDACNEQLGEVFKPYGRVDSAKIAEEDHSGRSLKFGFVQMGNDREARTAINALNGIKAQGRTIVVKKAIQASAHRLDVLLPISTYSHLSSGCQRVLGWLRGDLRVTTIWLCKLGAQPRVGTENEKRYGASVIYCFVQTKSKDQAIDDAETMVDENGWNAVSTIECRAVTRSTVPSGLVSNYRLARSEGDSIAVFPECIDFAPAGQS